MLRDVVTMGVGLTAGALGVFIGWYLSAASFANGWNDNAAQQRIVLVLAAYTLICLAGAVGFIVVGLLRRFRRQVPGDSLIPPRFTLVIVILQVLAALVFYGLLSGQGETRAEPLMQYALWVPPIIFGCVWAHALYRRWYP